MGNDAIIIAPESTDFVITLERFRESIADWQPYAHLAGPISDDDPIDANIQVTRPDEPFFQIFHYRNGDMLSTDGTEQQAAEVAAWAVNRFPKTGPGELWMTDQGYTGHAVLHPGMTATDIWPAWQDHSQPG
jgi:hypothetical protein